LSYAGAIRKGKGSYLKGPERPNLSSHEPGQGCYWRPPKDRTQQPIGRKEGAICPETTGRFEKQVVRQIGSRRFAPSDSRIFGS
jgi:hypothetical protein